MKDLTELIPERAIELIGLLQRNNYSAYLVGGCIRDIFLNKVPNDWDICTSAMPEQLIEMFKREGIVYHTVGIEFGTVTAILDNEEYEITTYRSDGNYVDGRHPEKVDYIDNIREDLSRRDFTINALAYNPITDELIDEYNGINDLKQGIIRAIGEPDKRFKEDALRILRAIRFAIQNEFKISSSTVKAMIDNLDLLDNVSKERITLELEKMLVSGKPIKQYFLEYKQIIGKIIPELRECFDFEQNKYHKHDVYEHMLSVVDLCQTKEFIIKLSALLHDIGKPVALTIDDKGYRHFYEHPKKSKEIVERVIKERLRLTAEQSKELLILVENHDNYIHNTKASVKRAMNKYGVEILKKWFILKQADISDHVFDEMKQTSFYMHIDELRDIMQEIINKAECFSLKDLAIGGDDVMLILNIKPSKEVGETLRLILEKVISGKLENKKEDLISAVKALK